MRLSLRNYVSWVIKLSWSFLHLLQLRSAWYALCWRSTESLDIAVVQKGGKIRGHWLFSSLWIEQFLNLHKHGRCGRVGWAIAYVRYIIILTRFRGFGNKIANFSWPYCLAIHRRELSTKKIKPNIEKWPESLGVTLEFWYIERGLFWITRKRVG